MSCIDSEQGRAVPLCILVPSDPRLRGIVGVVLWDSQGVKRDRDLSFLFVVVLRNARSAKCRMRSGMLSLCFLFSVLFSASAAQTRPLPIEVLFSPGGGCTEAVVRSLKTAKKSVHVQAYSFTSAPIAKALVDAHRRKVKVQSCSMTVNALRNTPRQTFSTTQGLRRDSIRDMPLLTTKYDYRRTDGHLGLV